MCDTRMNNGLNSITWLILGRMTRSRWRMVTLQILLKTPLSLKIRGRWDWWTFFIGQSTMETENFYCRSSSGERRFGSTPIIDLLSLFKLTTNSIIVSRKWLLSHILNRVIWLTAKLLFIWAIIMAKTLNSWGLVWRWTLSHLTRSHQCSPTEVT